MKFFDYDSYVKAETQGFEYFFNIDDYDIYVQTENKVLTSVTYKAIYHENIEDWQDGIAKLAVLNSDNHIDELEHAIKNYVGGVEEPLYPNQLGHSQYLKDSDYWQYRIEELLQLN